MSEETDPRVIALTAEIEAWRQDANRCLQEMRSAERRLREVKTEVAA